MVKSSLKFSLVFLFIGFLTVCCPFSNLPLFKNNETGNTPTQFLTQPPPNLNQQNTLQPTLTVNWQASPTPLSQSTQPLDLPDNKNLTSQVYKVSETIHIHNEGPGEASRMTLWVAMLRDITPYQQVLQVSSEPDYTELKYDEFGNEYAVFEILNISPDTSLDFTLSYHLSVNGLDFDLGNCQGELPDSFTQPEEFIESEALSITQLAASLSEGKTTACETVRSYYDYIAESFTYQGYTEDSLGALWAIENKGGDCTEFSDALIALSRAANIPARFVEGVVCCTEGGYIPSQNKHDWLEVYLPENGWVPMDPTWGKSSHDRETYFAGITSDHIIVTQGRNPSILNGYHYYSLHYWWETAATSINSEETWSILKIDE